MNYISVKLLTGPKLVAVHHMTTEGQQRVFHKPISRGDIINHWLPLPFTTETPLSWVSGAWSYQTPESGIRNKEIFSNIGLCKSTMIGAIKSFNPWYIQLSKKSHTTIIFNKQTRNSVLLEILKSFKTSFGLIIRSSKYYTNFKKNFFFIFLFYFNWAMYPFFFFLTVPHGMQDLSSLTRDWNCALCSRSLES